MTLMIPEFTKANVLVVGDVMLDRYWRGSTKRISPEAPVPVVRVAECDERPGGAGNVALNLVSLGVHTHLVSVVGTDDAGKSLVRTLNSANVDCHLISDPNLPTTMKLRVLSQQQQLIRLDFEAENVSNPDWDTTKIAIKWLKKVDAMIISDYGKGALSNISDLISKAREHNVFVLVDPKSTDFSCYHGASVITPNYAEFESVVGTCDNDRELIEKAQHLLQAHDIDALLITRGSQGMTLVERHTTAVHLPAHAREVFDVTGAGDTVISMLAAGLAAGSSLVDAAGLANLAGSIAVAKLGAATVTVPELRWIMRSYGDHDGGVVTEEQLLNVVAKAKAQRETVVMTNGCFDLLHAGHVLYLQQAKALGHRLIVAVNDDASVKALKGVGRPINSLSRRMAVLAALGVVDWVVPFSESTPARLISQVLPDFLVKGGDYQPEELAGADTVIENGGKVKILPYIDGCSTTQMVESISRNDNE